MQHKKIVSLVVAGLFLRLITSAFVYHTDVREFYQNVLQTESGVVSAYREKIQIGSTLPYPPLVYSVYGTYHKVFPWLFSSNFETWLSDKQSLHTEKHPGVFRDLLAMKLPMLMADFVIAWLIWKMAEKGRKDTALTVWILNPVTIYAIYATGQFDVIPTLLLVLSVFCWSRKKQWLTYPLLGLAGGLKLFPLLFVPMLFLLDYRKIWRRILGLISSVVVFCLTFWPIGLAVDVIKSIFSSTHTESMFKASINLGNGAVLSLALLIYAGFLLYLFLSKRKLSIEEIIVVLLALILGVTRFHPQWIVWLSPFAVLLLANGKIDGRLGVWLSVTYFGTIVLLPDKFTNFGLLKAVNNAFDSLAPIRDYLNNVGVGDKLYELMLAGFLAGGIAIFISLINGRQVEKDFGKINFGNRVGTIWTIEMAAILVLFVTAHVPLAFFGRYIDIENMSENRTVSLDKGITVSQKFVANHNNLNTIQVRVKNVNLVTKSTVSWRLLSKQDEVVASGEISGNVIGDDFDLTIKFPRIVDSKNKQYSLEFFDREVTAGEELIIPFDNRVKDGMMVNGIESGRLAYRTFYNPGGIKENIEYSLRRVFR